MKREAHIKRHKELHKKLDELIADYITHNKKGLEETNLMEFMSWSHEQTIEPTEEK